MAKPKVQIYSVTCEDVRSDSARKLEGIVADGILNVNGTVLPHRWFATASGEHIEISMDGIAFTFSPERQKLIEANAAKAAKESK